ncbi:MAG: acetolactate synthase small subunit [Syntrophales bacterium]|jgi:acetolactate synthase-1/3 small subunit|nr:acetolactate synthase small subunit [Syntrophales bacterium]MDY0043695.1 acetolactate synthase small subunit [Syntrophales bacterium]
MEVKNHTISLLVKNKPDVLARISGLLSGRGFNIENISANVTMNPDVTKITMVTKGDSNTVSKIEKQMQKLVDVIEVTPVRTRTSIQREMLLIRLSITRDNRKEILKAVDEYKGRIVAEGPDYFVIELTGSKKEIDHALVYFEAAGIEDMSRSGMVVL